MGRRAGRGRDLATARPRIERRVRRQLARPHAVFTWSIGDALVAALDALALADASAVALPWHAPPEIHQAIRDAGHEPYPLAADPETAGWDLGALRDATASGAVAAIVAWRLAGAPFADGVHQHLAQAPVPVIEASPRMALHGERCLPGAVATCISLAAPGRPAAVVVTDRADLAAAVAASRPAVPAAGPGAAANQAALDRWAATVYQHLTPPLRRRRPTADLRPHFELLVDVLQHIDRARLHGGPAIGWGETPAVLLALDDPARRRAVIDRLAEVDGLTVCSTETGAETAAEDDRDRRAPGGSGGRDPVEVSVLRPLSDDEARRLATISHPADPVPVPALHIDHVEPVRHGLGSRVGKRAFDLTVATGSIALVSPLLGAIAALVKIFDGGPVLFRQVRVGRDGQPFEMVKFRTMVVGADRAFSHHSLTNERTGPLFKVTDDPRATTLGKVLRRTSLDELPQLFNVVGGTMSLVGPRPPLPRERALFAPELLARETVRPGITGLWQVEARDDASFERYAELDLRYLATWTLAGDLSLLARTPAAVLRSALRRRPQPPAATRPPADEHTRAERPPSPPSVDDAPAAVGDRVLAVANTRRIARCEPEADVSGLPSDRRRSR